MGTQVGCVPGEEREKSLEREGLGAPSPQCVLHCLEKVSV